MIVKLAEKRGFCFGVEDAIEIAEKAVNEHGAGNVVSLGPDREELWSATFGPTIFYEYACGACPTADGVAVCGASKAFDGTDNARTGRLRLAVGDTIDLRTTTGAFETFEVTGSGGTG